MPIAIRHRDDAVPLFTTLPGLSVHRERDAAVMAGLQKRTYTEIQARFDTGNHAYVATMNGTPAAWGWVATSAATIGELKTSFSVSFKERYLWNFVTLPQFRGLGIYPRLLDAIVQAESAEGERFWIIYAPENHASGAGIMKAGFSVVAELSFDADGEPAVKDLKAGAGATASRFLGLPEVQQAVAQCWKCARSAAPEESSCRKGMCMCDYQRPETTCAA